MCVMKEGMSILGQQMLQDLLQHSGRACLLISIRYRKVGGTGGVQLESIQAERKIVTKAQKYMGAWTFEEPLSQSGWGGLGTGGPSGLSSPGEEVRCAHEGTKILTSFSWCGEALMGFTRGEI